MKSDECFVVMPFGVRAIPDGSGKTYDFDKVYRVLIQRAIQESGMAPIRADERVGSALIHIDMFRDLRDRSVVLADLSLDNPNVFYELGIRHVMSSNGTVLICRSGSVLPFDVKLSRVIFYEFDGASLDWDEVERVVKHLKVALQEARKGLPDSPVYALLESVLRERSGAGQELGAPTRPEYTPDAEPLTRYQELLADYWTVGGESPKVLFDLHRGSVFGMRSLAQLVLKTDPLSDLAKRLANHLNDGAQYNLANELYSRLHEAGKLTRGSLLAYASSFSETHSDLSGAERAIALAREALEGIEREYDPGHESAEAVAAYGEAHRRLAGLCQWKWQLSRDPAELDQALSVFADAIRYTQRARDLGATPSPVGFLAQCRFKQLLLLRIRDQNVDRPDTERHRDEILALHPHPNDDPTGISYLGWFQAFAFADIGAGEQAQQKALATFADDAKHRLNPENWEIGRRQYVLLRRFLEQYAPYLHNPTFIGRVSQVLQAGDASR